MRGGIIGYIYFLLHAYLYLKHHLQYTFITVIIKGMENDKSLSVKICNRLHIPAPRDSPESWPQTKLVWGSLEILRLLGSQQWIINLKIKNQAPGNHVKCQLWSDKYKFWHSFKQVSSLQNYPLIQTYLFTYLTSLQVATSVLHPSQANWFIGPMCNTL